MAAYAYPDNDCDSTFGDDSNFWSPMLSPPPVPLAGSKRDADHLHDPQTTAPGFNGTREHRAGHIHPPASERHSCVAQTPCAPVSDSRPSKRRASALKVSEFHHPVGGEWTTSGAPDSDQQFYDKCFHELCKGCDYDNTCNPACSLSCPGEGACSPDDVCFDPHCEDTCDPDQCLDKCVDPECTKTACPNDPCFCQDCGAQPCPLGDLDNECHLVHSAPASGTIYCFDNGPCHFQTGHHYSDPNLAVYNSHPCFSESHNTLGYYDATNPPSSAATPALSSGNFSSMDSYSHQSTPMPSSQPTRQCFLGDPASHCHLDPDSCCHGSSRDHGQLPTPLQDTFDFWDPSFSQSGLENALMNFGFQTGQPTGSLSLESPTTSITTPTLTSGYHDKMLGFDNSSWMFNESPTFPAQEVGSNIPLNYLASAAFVSTTPFNSDDLLSSSANSAPIQRPLTSCSSTSSDAYVCKWNHGSGMLCGLQFNSAELLHKHTKTAHVDNCTSCFCQWEGCEACDKDFKQRSKLSRHLLGHAGYRPYACSFAGCDKTFATNQAKENHERVHTGDKPYICDHPGCDYRTTTHTQLQTHIAALHQKKKIHRCRYCPFTCADSSNLSKHERTHQTLRPYRCPHLGCTFKPDCRWENLKRHLRRSNHCPELLVENSIEYKKYREDVKREIEVWHKRNETGPAVVNARRKGKKE